MLWRISPSNLNWRVFRLVGTTPAQEIGGSHTPSSEPSAQSATAAIKNVPRPVMSAKSNVLRLTIDHIPYPAYMVNYNFAARRAAVVAVPRLPTRMPS